MGRKNTLEFKLPCTIYNISSEILFKVSNEFKGKRKSDLVKYCEDLICKTYDLKASQGCYAYFKNNKCLYVGVSTINVISRASKYFIGESKRKSAIEIMKYLKEPIKNQITLKIFIPTGRIDSEQMELLLIKIFEPILNMDSYQMEIKRMIKYESCFEKYWDLHHKKRLSFDEIAEMEGKSKGYIYNRYLMVIERRKRLLKAMIEGLLRCPKLPDIELNKAERFKNINRRI